MVYTIIRSSMLRAILASGLHPTFGIFHKNRKKCTLAWSMISWNPYRPIVDQIVKQLEQRGITTLTVESKEVFMAVVTADQTVIGSVSPMFRHMQQMTHDLSELYWQGQKYKA